MTIEQNGNSLRLADAVTLLRQDIAQVRTDLGADIRDSEARTKVEIDAARSSFLSYQADHIGVHNRRAEDTDRIHDELAKRLDAMTIVEARRAGALAVTLLVIRTIGTHWQALLALVALVGVLLGKVDIDISGPVLQ